MYQNLEKQKESHKGISVIWVDAV